MEAPTRAELSPAERVVSAVSMATGHDPSQFGTLYDVVDPDVLNGFVRHGPRSAANRLVFHWAGCEVTLHGDGCVKIGIDPVSDSDSAPQCETVND